MPIASKYGKSRNQPTSGRAEARHNSSVLQNVRFKRLCSGVTLSPTMLTTLDKPKLASPSSTARKNRAGRVIIHFSGPVVILANENKSMEMGKRKTMFTSPIQNARAGV